MNVKALVLLYTFLVIFTIVWLIIAAGIFCPSSLPQPRSAYPHARGSQDYNYRTRWRELESQEETMRLKQRKLDLAIENLSKLFPHEAAALMGLSESKFPKIFAVTPTHTRPYQKAELTRLINTFLHVPNFHWIVVEDDIVKTELVEKLLKKSGLSYTHLYMETPINYKLQQEDPNWLKPRGVQQRNKGLEWLRTQADPGPHGAVVYFADDDNTYDIRLFEEMRFTNTVSVWPVGLVGKLRYESPVCRDGKVTGWFTAWGKDRKFALDMAGFAVNFDLIRQHPEAEFNISASRGFLESSLLQHLVNMDQLEPKAGGCSTVLVWHTRSEKPDLRNEEKLKKATGHGSDPRIEV